MRRFTKGFVFVDDSERGSGCTKNTTNGDPAAADLFGKKDRITGEMIEAGDQRSEIADLTNPISSHNNGKTGETAESPAVATADDPGRPASTEGPSRGSVLVFKPRGPGRSMLDIRKKDHRRFLRRILAAITGR